MRALLACIAIATLAALLAAGTLSQPAASLWDRVNDCPPGYSQYEDSPGTACHRS